MRCIKYAFCQQKNPQGEVEYAKVKFVYPTRPTVTTLRKFNLLAHKGMSVAVVGPRYLQLCLFRNVKFTSSFRQFWLITFSAEVESRRLCLCFYAIMIHWRAQL